MAKYVEMPYVSIVFDPAKVSELQKQGEMVIYGDAVNEPVLKKAYVETADVVVVSVGDTIASMSIIEKVRHLNKHAYLLVRAKGIGNVENLYKIGADQVVPEKLETAIDLFERILANRLMPKRKIASIISEIRTNYYGIFRDRDDKHKNQFLSELPNLEIIAVKVDQTSAIVGKSLSQINLRKRMQVTLLAIKRDQNVMEHPTADTVFCGDDILYLLGNNENLEKAANTVNLTAAEEVI